MPFESGLSQFQEFHNFQNQKSLYNNISHLPLLLTIRDEFVDCIYYGSIYLAKGSNIVWSYGADKKNICFLRSLMKPLQAAICADCNIINDYNFTNKELAIVQGSHSGSDKHIGLLKNLMKKGKLKLSDLELLPSEPLDTRDFRKTLRPKKTKLHNNCSGKHVLMALMSKYLSYDISGYTNPEHPLQKLIKKKQDELSQYKSEILTFDGCSTPLWGMPYENLVLCFNNYFNDEKYFPLINAVLKNPYYFGGFERLDSEIIQKSKGKLWAKTGAGGFLLIYNFKENSQLIIKMAQNNNEARRLIALDLLNRLGWLEVSVSKYEYNQKSVPVAKYSFIAGDTQFKKS